MRRGLLLFTTLIVALVPVFTFSSNVHAISVSGFDPGRIIDDAIFYDQGGVGSVQEVQNFLNAHVPSCDTWGTGRSGYGNLNNAQYAQQVKGWPGPPYVCLNNYYENPSTGETSFEKGGGAFDGGISTAQIIYDAAQQYKINPKVLLVLLRKESLNLFSDSWPLKSQYKYAMGYACPDSGPGYSAACQDSKAGFYKQMTLAAWQLRYYYDHMGSYNFAPGRVNTIQYSPDPSCGTKNVYIQNYATASLYIYTPYTPNDAALNAYPGTASCGAYGNRNFWFYWQEWFGSTLTNSNFVRSVDNATVYLIGDKVKYPVGDVNLLGAASSLGGVGFVSQAYLDNIPTGPLLGRIIQSPDGTIYFYDTNIKLPFGSCTMVASYGGSCGAAAELTQAQIDRFVTGPGVTSVYKTTSGKTFYITNGTKREVYDSASLSSIGINDSANTLTETGISYLPYTAPVIRNNVVVTNRTDGQKYLYTSGVYSKLPSIQANYPYIKSLNTNSLDNNSLVSGQISAGFTGFVTDTTTNKTYMLTANGKVEITSPNTWGITNPTSIDSALISSIPTSSASINNGIVMSNDSGTVYYVTGGQKRPIPGWGNLVDLKVQPFAISTIDNLQLTTIPTGPLIYAPGHVVKTNDSATVYIVKSYTELMPISSFVYPQELGASSTLETMSRDDFSKYTVSGAVQTLVTCSGQNYAGLGGTLYPMNTVDMTKFGLTQANFVDAGMMCNAPPKTTRSVPEFILDGTGTIYLVRSGSKHAFTGYGAYVANGGSSQNTIKVSNYFANVIPNGANISQ